MIKMSLSLHKRRSNVCMPERERASASARKTKSEAHPPKNRRTVKKKASEAPDTSVIDVAAGPEEHDDVGTTDPEQHADDVQDDEVMRDIEEEVAEQDDGGDGAKTKIWRPPWVSPYEGQPDPATYPRGPFEKNLLVEYGSKPHIAMCVCDDIGYRPSGPQDCMGWPRQGRMLEHLAPPTKNEGAALMMELLRSSEEDAYDQVEKTKGAHCRAYLLLLLVGTTIFSNKAKNYVDLKILTYLRHLDRVVNYSRGTAALTFLYHELTNATAPSCKYVAGYMTLLQSGWIRCGPTKVVYLPERVLRQFGYVQQIPRHPASHVLMTTTLEQIAQQWMQQTYHIMTPELLGSRVTFQSEAAVCYMGWYSKVSHSFILPIPDTCALTPAMEFWDTQITNFEW
ncbi:IMP dehydrogenase/GMP reductase related [Trifolium medium]|uniref:IMP dehydrogenase/GMP reductase related n=1 Tax=Trifolium medium TaxID=97028 RepID=A0A392LX67_9FABA|nr:IMP dehydrogenase/GMP reductase related [Trifolium medium]